MSDLQKQYLESLVFIKIKLKMFQNLRPNKGFTKLVQRILSDPTSKTHIFNHEWQVTLFIGHRLFVQIYSLTPVFQYYPNGRREFLFKDHIKDPPLLRPLLLLLSLSNHGYPGSFMCVLYVCVRYLCVLSVCSLSVYVVCVSVCVYGTCNT